MLWSGSKLFPALIAFVLLWGVVVFFSVRSIGVSADTVYEPPKLIPRPAVVVKEPSSFSIVDNPLTISGKAKGTWFFEASFPVVIKDAKGVVLGQAPAQAQGNWMTTDYVPFSLSLAYDDPITASGTLELKKDNPSGLPQNDATFKVPIRFR